MTTYPAPTSRRLFIAGVAGTGALGVLALLLIRGMTYRGAVAWSSQLPGPIQDLVAAISDYGILGLLALFAVAAVQARRRGLTHLARGVAAGGGVVLAYASSEAIKVLVNESRPCHNFNVATIASCPGASDWSWPSNHATISVAIALAVLLMAPRLAMLALPLAALIGLSRVAVGVHYFHDIMAGAVLAALVVTICTSAGTPPIHRLLEWSQRFPPIARLITTDTDQSRPPRRLRLDGPQADLATKHT